MYSAPCSTDPVCSALSDGESMPHLQFERDGQSLFLHLLRPGRTVLGRSDRCDVALPAEGVSRVHCVIEQRPEGWLLTDRSKHGITVDTEPVRRTVLTGGERIAIGPYHAHFLVEGDEALRAPTSTLPMTAALYEEILDISDTAMTAAHAKLSFTGGPRSGETVRLDRPRMGLGGGQSAVRLSDDIPANALWLRVVRGRVMLEPGNAPAMLAGVRVRDITPALAGEEIRIGENTFVIEVDTVSAPAREVDAFDEMVGSTPSMKKLFGILHRMALHDAPVLVLGESGTGKELAARGLHEAGPRSEKAFVAMNCAAIAENLFESELFGHEKGAFTGATQRQEGAFQRADGGTLFLDEVGELKLDLQAKLLRALECGEVRRVGAAKPEYPDVRVVAATNRNLPKMVREGTFREDLFFRLSVLPVRLPPLRERRPDLELLVNTLLARNHPGCTAAPDAIEALKGYDWPGNIRELRNVLTRAVVLTGPVIHAGDLAFNPWAFENEPKDAGPVLKDDSERATIAAALEQTEGNRTQAARMLGMPRSSLLYKMRRLGMM